MIRNHQDCRGLRTNLDIFNCNTSCFNYVLIVLRETWLTYNFYTSELGHSYYNVFRCDRSPQTSQCNRNGGVLGNMRKDIASSPF